MCEKIENVGSSDTYRDALLEEAVKCFNSIIRVSNTVTGSQGAVNRINGSFVSTLSYKASLIAETIA